VKTYVVDASIILKWVLGDDREADQRRALDLLTAWADGAAEIAAPSLWQYEVGNFLGRQLGEEAMEKMGSLLKLGIRAVNLDENMIRRCFSWMKERGVTFYDASYLAVALEIGASLITADQRFAKKMEEADQICLLRDLDL
jgi:predicted nucleic acid-binding protein